MTTERVVTWLSARAGTHALVAIALLTSTSISSCKGTDQKSGDSTRIGGDSAQRLVASDTVKIPEFAPTCNIDGSQTGGLSPCRGLLSSAFASAPTWKELEASLSARGTKTLKAQPPSMRHMDCVSIPSSNCDQSIAPYVNVDARGFRVADLTPEKPIVVGAMQFKKNGKYNDRRYGVGKDLDDDLLDSDHKKSKVYIVAYANSQANPQNPPYGIIVARWKMFSVVKGTNQLTEGPSGVIVNCTPRHPTQAGIDASFISCVGQSRLHALDQATTADFSALIHADTANQSRGEAIKVLLQKRAPSLLAMFDSVTIAQLGAADAPYWFSCASGCCTADF